MKKALCVLLLLCLLTPSLCACTVNLDGLDGVNDLIGQAADYLNSLQNNDGSSVSDTGGDGTDTEAMTDSEGNSIGGDGQGDTTQDRPTNGGNGGGNPSSGEIGDEEEAVDPSATLPQASLNGKQINILIGSERKDEYHRIADDGTIVGQAVYQRHVQTEFELNCTLNYIREPSGEGDTDSFCEKAEELVVTGEVDLYAAYSQVAAPLMIQGWLKNLRENEVLSLDAAWWNPSLIENCTVYDKLYFCSGDIAYSLYDSTYAILYNREMEESLNEHVYTLYGEEDIYALVQNGGWTLEVFTALADATYEDLDGSCGKSGGDLFGYTAELSAADSFFYGCGWQQIENSNNRLSLSSDLNTTTELPDMIATLRRFLSGNAVAVKGVPGDTFELGVRLADLLWNEKQALFYHAPLSRLREESKVETGLLPVPKHDYSQKNYLTCPGYDFTVWGVCASGSDDSFYVLEYLAQLGHYHVTPAYFRAISRSALQSERDVQMLECIKNGIVIDAARLFDGSFDVTYASLWKSALQQSEFNYVTAYEPKKTVFGHQVEQLNEQIKNME